MVWKPLILSLVRTFITRTLLNVILVNDQYSSLPFIPTLGNYSLHSGVTFEEIEFGDNFEPTNHFMCLGFSEDGYFIYDNLLRLTYQGGFYL